MITTFKTWDKIPKDFEGECFVDVFNARIWIKKGKILHREDGPAICGINGLLEWWFYSKKHRLDGPAVIYPSDGEIQFYIFGTKYSEQEYWSHALVIKYKLDIILNAQIQTNDKV